MTPSQCAMQPFSLLERGPKSQEPQELKTGKDYTDLPFATQLDWCWSKDLGEPQNKEAKRLNKISYRVWLGILNRTIVDY